MGHILSVRLFAQVKKATLSHGNAFPFVLFETLRFITQLPDCSQKKRNNVFDIVQCNLIYSLIKWEVVDGFEKIRACSARYAS